MRTAHKFRLQLPVYVERPTIHDGTLPDSVHFAPNTIAHGYLERLLELPVEIFAEVCAFLDPLDLRTLSISGHVFRGILMSRDARPIWARARLRLYGSMPDPPEDMSEPEYARFLFANECYRCDRTATEIDCFNRIKSCFTCSERYYVNYQEATFLYPGLPVQHIRGTSSHHNHERIKPYHKTTLRAEFWRYSEDDETSAAEYEAALKERCRVMAESGNVLAMWMKNEAARQAKAFQDRHDIQEER